MLDNQIAKNLKTQIIAPLIKELLEIIKKVEELGNQEHAARILEEMQRQLNSPENNSMIKNYIVFIDLSLESEQDKNEAISFCHEEIFKAIKAHIDSIKDIYSIKDLVNIKNKILFLLQGLDFVQKDDFLINSLSFILDTGSQSSTEPMLFSQRSNNAHDPNISTSSSSNRNNSTETSAHRAEYIKTIQAIKNKVTALLQQNLENLSLVDDLFKALYNTQNIYDVIRNINKEETIALINIFQLIQNIKPEIIKDLINYIPEGYENSLLLLALEQENLSLSLFLLQNGGDIAVANMHGINAIHMLAMVHPEPDKIEGVKNILDYIYRHYPDKLKQLINASRIASYDEPNKLHTGIPLFKVISFSKNYMVGGLKKFKDLQEYIKTINSFINLWREEKYGIKINDSQLPDFLPRIIKMNTDIAPEEGTGDSDIAYAAYLDTLNSLLPKLFLWDHLLRESDKFLETRSLNAFEASLMGDPILFKFIYQLYPNETKNYFPKIEDLFIDYFIDRIRNTYSAFFNESACLNPKFNLQDNTNSLINSINNLAVVRNLKMIVKNCLYTNFESMKEKLTSKLWQRLDIESKTYLNRQQKDEIVTKIKLSIDCLLAPNINRSTMPLS